MKILSIDDSRSVHAFISVCLDGTGHELEHAYNGFEGLKLLGLKEFDLILLDWEMPDLIGPDTLVEILKLKPTANVVMVTTKNDPEDIRRVLNIGAKDFIMKPFTKDILLSKLEQF
jgi:two-component system, chemotaxis family, chemotaxis protein CheY